MNNDMITHLLRVIRRLTMPLAMVVALISFAGIFIASTVEAINLICTIAGVVGIIYIVVTICTFANPIKRDWMMINKSYVVRLITFVLFIPFAVTLMFTLFVPDFSSHHMVGDPNCYPEIPEVVTEGDSQNSTLLEQIRKVRSEQQTPHIIWTVYYHFIDPGNQHLAISPKGRGYSAMLAVLGIFFLNGLLISTITSSFANRRERWLKGEVRYNRMLKYRPHYVIIGGIDVAKGVVKQLFDINGNGGKMPYILIQINGDVETFRSELYSMLGDEQLCRHVIIYRGVRTSPKDLEDLMLGSAIEVYIFGEECNDDTNEKYHDILNMRCLEHVSEIYTKSNTVSGRRLTCRMMFEYQTSFSVFQFADVSNRIKNNINFIPFNFYEMWAQKVFICRELSNYTDVPYLPLEGVDGISSESDSHVHLVLLGMSRMAMAMAIEAAHLAHYPNFETKHRRTRITIIDENMMREKDLIMGRFKSLFTLSPYAAYRIEESHYAATSNTEPADTFIMPSDHDHLGCDFIDIEWEFIEGRIESNGVHNYLTAAANDKSAKLTIAVCLPDSNSALASALYLPKEVYDNANQVLVYQRGGEYLVDELRGGVSYGAFRDKLRPFGMAYFGYDYTMVDVAERIAKCVNDDYQTITESKQVEALADRLCDTYADTQKLNSVKNNLYNVVEKYSKSSKATLRIEALESTLYAENSDICERYSTTGLKKTDTAKRWSSIYNANMLWTKLRCIGYNTEQDSLTEKQLWEISLVEHNRWNIEQLLMNYRPLTQDEQVLLFMRHSSQLKEILKGKMAHYNICSWQLLTAIDSTFKLDVGLTQNLIKYYLKTKDKR